MWISYGHLFDQICSEVKSFRMASRVAETYEKLATIGEQQTRSSLGSHVFHNHIKILSAAGLYPFDDEPIEIVRGFDGRQALDLLGSRMISIRPVEDYPIGTSFIVRQIVYNIEGLLLSLDVLLGKEVIDIVGPFDTIRFSELFVYS